MLDSHTTGEQMSSISDSLQNLIDNCRDVIRHLNDRTREGDRSGEP